LPLPTFSAPPPLREQNARVYAEPRADGGGSPFPIRKPNLIDWREIHA
jgi:hypothetical protein